MGFFFVFTRIFPFFNTFFWFLCKKTAVYSHNSFFYCIFVPESMNCGRTHMLWFNNQLMEMHSRHILLYNNVRAELSSKINT